MSDLIERYKNLVKTGFEYASSDKGSAPTSTFEIYVGHFKDIGVEIADRLASLEREVGDKGDGWQTIDTAPKDETDILLADCRVHGGFMTVASYEIVDGSEWVWHTNDGPSYHTEAFTHWRPLPAAPSASIEGETNV